MKIAIETKQLNPEHITQLQTYSEVLALLLSNQNANEFTIKNFHQLLKLYRHFVETLPKLSESSFRQYGDKENEAKMKLWEKQYPDNSTNLVTRPDGVKGVFIKITDKSDNWYTIPNEFSEKEMTEFFQRVIAITILSAQLFTRGSIKGTEYLTSDQLQTHLEWVNA